MVRLISWTILGAILIILLNVGNSFPFESRIDESTCTYKQTKLYGKVQVVENLPDIKVKVVTSFPDLKVKLVTSFPDDCGEWEMAEFFPDLKVQFVESLEDIKIQFVESFPGIP